MFEPRLKPSSPSLVPVKDGRPNNNAGPTHYVPVLHSSSPSPVASLQAAPPSLPLLTLSMDPRIRKRSIMTGMINQRFSICKDATGPRPSQEWLVVDSGEGPSWPMTSNGPRVLEGPMPAPHPALHSLAGHGWFGIGPRDGLRASGRIPAGWRGGNSQYETTSAV